MGVALGVDLAGVGIDHDVGRRGDLEFRDFLGPYARVRGRWTPGHPEQQDQHGDDANRFPDLRHGHSPQHRADARQRIPEASSDQDRWRHRWKSRTWHHSPDPSGCRIWIHCACQRSRELPWLHSLGWLAACCGSARTLRPLLQRKTKPAQRHSLPGRQLQGLRLMRFRSRLILQRFSQRKRVSRIHFAILRTDAHRVSHRLLPAAYRSSESLPP